LLLDGLAGVELVNAATSVAETAISSQEHFRDASVVAVVTGSRAEVPVLRLAGEQFAPGVRVVSIRAHLGAASSRRPAGNTTVLDVGHLDDLERLLNSAGGV
jgi:hypothetical protein